MGGTGSDARRGGREIAALCRASPQPNLTIRDLPHNEVETSAPTVFVTKNVWSFAENCSEGRNCVVERFVAERQLGWLRMTAAMDCFTS